MKFSDEMLMAFADGELDLVARAEIGSSIDRDGVAARAVARHRAIAAAVRAAYEGVLDEPLPPALAALAGDEEAALAAAAQPRAGARLGAPTWRLPAWSTVAIGLLVGLLAGVLLFRGANSPYVESPAGLVADGALAEGLERSLATDSTSADVAIQASFRHRDGRYCRTFVFRHGTSVAGLACRSRDAWKIELLADAPRAGEGHPQPVTLPMPVLRAVDAAIDGAPLDAVAESAARNAGWRNSPDVAE